ncbi:MAG: hypothetical protein JNJ88_12420 [Planctomycetes bacterium]|nr:hypothetical protein [Planctomycetota bacterium]
MVLDTELSALVLTDLLPEVLHDWNNECAVVSGLAHLLAASNDQGAAIRDRAAALGLTGERMESEAWCASTLVNLLAGDSPASERDDALELALELASSAIRRRGGAWSSSGMVVEASCEGRAAMALAAWIRWCALEIPRFSMEPRRVSSDREVAPIRWMAGGEGMSERPIALLRTLAPLGWRIESLTQGARWQVHFCWDSSQAT